MNLRAAWKALGNPKKLRSRLLQLFTRLSNRWHHSNTYPVLCLVAAVALLLFRRCFENNQKMFEWGLTSITAFLVAWMVNVQIARPRREQDLAMDLYRLYNSQAFLDSRKKAWDYLHPTESEGGDRILKFRIALIWDWCVFEVEASTLEHADDSPKSMRRRDHLDGARAVRTLGDFFATCELCLAEKRVDPDMLNALVGHSFARWSELNVEKFIRNPNYIPLEELMRMPEDLSKWKADKHPMWLTGLPLFRDLCGLERTNPTPWKLPQPNSNPDW